MLGFFLLNLLFHNTENGQFTDGFDASDTRGLPNS